MNLQNLLLECEISTRTQVYEVMGGQSLTNNLMANGDLKPIFKEKCREFSSRLATLNDLDALTEDEVFWYTSIALISSIFSRKTQ